MDKNEPDENSNALEKLEDTGLVNTILAARE